jgi:hypothetical protein
MSLELIADDEEGYDEITPFLRIMHKLNEDSKEVGFLNRYSNNERTILKGIWEKVKKDAESVLEKTNKKTSQGTQSS